MSDPANPQGDPRALPPGAQGAGLVRAPAPGSLAPVEPPRLHAFPAEDEGHFWDYWAVLVRHRWTIVSFFVVTVLVGTVWTFTTRPLYTATATLRIDKEEPRVLKFERVVPGEQADYQQTQYQTQLKMLQSRTLANRVIGLLSLDQHPEFQQPDGVTDWLETTQAWAREQLVRWIPVPPPPPPEASEDLTLESPLTHVFQNRLSVESARNARLVGVAFESHYPDLSARVANTLVDAFIAQHLDQKIETTRYATQFLAQQMQEAREKLEAAEEKLNRFLEANDILFLGSPDRLGERQDLVTQQLTVLSDALLKARTERIAKESLVHQALSQRVDAVPAVLQNPLVAKLKEELVGLEGESRKLGQTFKPEYPRMQRLQENIAEVRRQIHAEIARVVDSLDADYRAALRSERELEKAVGEHRSLARRLGDRMAEYSLLRRDLDTSRELYTSLLTRLKETQISSVLVTSNISIVDRAEVPLVPSKPRKGLNLLLAAVIGLGGGVGLAFFFEYLDTNIRDPREVESLLRVPTLGLVPSQALAEGRPARWRWLGQGEDEGAPFPLVAHLAADSIFAEAFRNLRTSLLYSAPDQPPRTVVVTSLQPEDGKTSVATNLAITLAQLAAGEILLVDGDMRRPNLHELLDLPQAPGLSTFLTGQAELPAVLRPTRVSNLYVIPSGRTPLNPAELMASRRLGQALEVLRERFAHIVFDAPPLIGVSDALTLASRVDGVIVVLRHGRAGRDAAQRAIHLLASVRARLLGVVLNDVDRRAAGAGYYDYYYRSYGHGHEEPPSAGS